MKPTSGLERDTDDLNKVLAGFFVSYWKGAKLYIRSFPVTTETSGSDFEKLNQGQAEKFNLGKNLRHIYNIENVFNDQAQSHEPVSARDLLGFVREVYAMSDTIKSMDEDAYPTFMEVLSNSRRLFGGKPLNCPEYWNNSLDHWLFAVAMELKSGFGSWKTYELERVNPRELGTTDFRVMAEMHQGINRMASEWYYLADQSFSRALDELCKEEVSLHSDTRKLLSWRKNSDLSSEEQFRSLARAGAFLFRGFSRHQTGESEQEGAAVTDLQQSLHEFSRLGIDNELVWMTETYLFIKNGKQTEAIESLQQLESSRYLTSREKALVSEAKSYLQKRDPEKALNFVTDRIVIYRLGLNYATTYAEEIEWVGLLAKSKEGQKILTRFSDLRDTYEKARQYLDLDKMGGDGKKLWKKVRFED
jgi:hypothetical protein